MVKSDDIGLYILLVFTFAVVVGAFAVASSQGSVGAAGWQKICKNTNCDLNDGRYCNGNISEYRDYAVCSRTNTDCYIYNVIQKEICPYGCQNGACIQGKFFAVDVLGEKFNIFVTDPRTIQDAMDNYYGKNNKSPIGKLLYGDDNYNQPWSWHLNSSSIRMTEFAMELCDGKPSDVENNLTYWLRLGSYCPWSGKIVNISLNCLYDICQGGSGVDCWAKDNTCVCEQCPIVSCTDTDKGVDYYIIGKVYGIDEKGQEYSYPDFCDPTNKTVLNEMYCDGTAPRSIWYFCPYGCQDGACLPEQKCTDSDGGKNATVAGYVKYNGQTYYDDCGYKKRFNAYWVKEYYCSGDKMLNTTIDCQKLCIETISGDYCT